MSANEERPRTGTMGDYVLGTHDAEVERLGLQHRVWREVALGAWRRAGLGEGARVIDVGAGPGYATLDLAELVGPGGHVLAVERSPRFAAELRDACARRGFAQVTVVEADLMTPPAAEGYDAAWCRWVASFVRSPETLVRWLAGALRPGGRAIFQEYVAYETWRYLPRRLALEEFRAAVVASWRADGGEPDIAGPLAGLLATGGFTIAQVRPHVFTAAPGEPMWRWPESFVETNLARLVELGRVDAAWSERVSADLRAAGEDASTRMLTPVVAEILAVRTQSPP